MIKREFKINFKAFCIWLLILLGTYLFTYLIYPYIINEESIKTLDDLMATFPDGVLKAFNMDMSSLTTAYGWFKSEGFIYILIVTGLYSSIMGGTILLKEENDLTIEYLGSLPIKRSKIVTNKIIVSITYILLMILIIGVFNYICLTLSCEYDVKQFLLLSITPLFTALPLFAISLFLSTLLHKTKGAIGIGLAFVFISYFFNILSELSESVEVLKYFSIYTLADTRDVIENISINPICPLIGLGITIIFILLSYIRYNNKELL